MSKLGLVQGSSFIQFEPLGQDFPVDPGLSWETVPDETDFDWTWNGSAAVPPTPETLEEQRTRLYVELYAQTGVVREQGIDGPRSRAYPSVLAATTVYQSILDANAVTPTPAMTPLYSINTLSGELEAANNSNLNDLIALTWAHNEATNKRAQTVNQQINDATNQTEMDAAEAAIYTGWPPLPTNTP